MIQITDVCKSFHGIQALSHASMHVPKGAVYGLVGPNGAGKSTLLRHITGIYQPDSGTILVDGEPIYNNSSMKGRIAYIPDDIFYFIQSSTLDMKNFYKSIYPSFDEKLFIRLKDCFPDLDPKISIRRLSRGMQKQAAFWIALCCMPDLFVMDEPIDGLDPVMRRQIWNLILTEVSERNTTVLVSSHNLRELEDICDHVGIMHHGQIILERSLSELQGSVCKIQVAFQEGMPNLPDSFQILHMSNIGRVYTLIVKGDPVHAQEALSAMHPLLIDVVPLSLEEIFIYEMGGMNYEIKEILF